MISHQGIVSCTVIIILSYNRDNYFMIVTVCDFVYSLWCTVI